MTTIQLQFTSQQAPVNVAPANYAAACRQAYAAMRTIYGAVLRPGKLFFQEFTGADAVDYVWIVADGRPAQGFSYGN